MLNYSGTDGLGCGRVFDDAAWTQGRGGEGRGGKAAYVTRTASKEVVKHDCSKVLLEN